MCVTDNTHKLLVGQPSDTEHYPHLGEISCGLMLSGGTALCYSDAASAGTEFGT